MPAVGKDTAWWYWLATLVALTAGVSGWERGVGLAIATTLAHMLHYLRRGHRPTDFPLQVRLGYAALLAAGLWPHLALLHWMQMAGTTALLARGTARWRA